jgi:hypothetical protein
VPAGQQEHLNVKMFTLIGQKFSYEWKNITILFVHCRITHLQQDVKNQIHQWVKNVLDMRH